MNFIQYLSPFRLGLFLNAWADIYRVIDPTRRYKVEQVVLPMSKGTILKSLSITLESDENDLSTN